MTAVRPGEIEGLLRRGPDPRILLVLVYGPDIGLVADRSARLVKGMTADPDDPFALVKLDGDALASDPGRLVDEAGTIGLFGGSRTIWVRSGSRNYAPAVDALLKADPAGARIVVEAGDLQKSSPLRAVCERSSRALAIPCYPDDARTLTELIENTLREYGLGIDRDARDLLAQSLGADRRASLSEIEKLALYARGRDKVELDDVEAIVSDVGASVLNALIDAAFAGRMAEAEREVRRFRQEGLDPSAMLGAALRHALALLNARLDDPSASASSLVANWRGLHFKRKGLVETQLSRWSPGALRHAAAALQEAVLACRRSDAGLAQAHASAALLRIAGEAARRRG
ncbi:DNA polymerase III subunit delta [Methylobacterium gnaphalii]|uniref:DNA-directed DNA polymerase n=1 Tax=Methylobacterium gnaphalii TaxID=1010610 RepID=A0A512JG75_9HYPH|nr:DNA polymerase III subunit delta [Methylobacterium gnaphalii]GEP08948.1 DNA polymerase III subunit delta [Methylobacterium gnaphalii]GJD67490.1 hypothetical protein MMMDOFMJ_0405 [Methylobacterium gnaphalii]GLS48181.1 DNA polymerase III subunit delta [Methylobacterium gnaphalii]